MQLSVKVSKALILGENYDSFSNCYEDFENLLSLSETEIHSSYFLKVLKSQTLVCKFNR